MVSPETEARVTLAHQEVDVHALPKYPLFILLIVIVVWAVPARGEEASWDKLVSAAKKEGKVVVAGPPDPSVRKDLPARFSARFGISMEYIGGRGSEIAGRVKRERAAGVHTLDAFLTGLSTVVSVLYPEQMLAPLRPALILPEVVDASKWKEGKLWFMDPEEQYVLRLFRFVSPLVYINTEHVNPKELTSIKELLNAKWKGKISVSDPTAIGSGGGTAARFFVQFGKEFVQRLYVDQQPVITRDDRQMTDWLLRGTYPISLNAREEDIERLRREGFPLMAVYSLKDAPGRVSGGTGYVTLIEKAPHPNAAQLFVNWLASKEGLEVYSRGYGSATLRRDVDESFLPPEVIPRAGVNYFDGGDWKFTSFEDDIRRQVRELLKR